MVTAGWSGSGFCGPAGPGGVAGVTAAGCGVGGEVPRYTAMVAMSVVVPQACVCVILYFYPATCGPKGHGSGSAAALRQR